MKLQELVYILSGETKIDIEARSRYAGYSSVETNIAMKDLGTCKYRDEEIVVMWPSGTNTMIVVIDKVVD